MEKGFIKLIGAGGIHFKTELSKTCYKEVHYFNVIVTVGFNLSNSENIYLKHLPKTFT